MKQLSRVLYVTDPEVQLCLKGEAVECAKPENLKVHIPLLDLESIVSFSYNPATMSLLAKCAEEGIGFSCVSKYGKLKYRVIGSQKGNVTLRRAQVYFCDSAEGSLEISKIMIRAKIENSISTLESFAKNHFDRNKLILDSVKAIKEELLRLDTVWDKDELRGIEGICSALYFRAFKHMILSDDIRFDSRNRRPPKDPVNVLLSLAYTALCNDCITALETVGLDPYIGVMHGLRSGKPSLALDIMEEMRAAVADRFVLRLINLKIINLDMFEISEDGCTLSKNGLKRFYSEWSSFKNSEIRIADVGKIKRGLLPYIQAKNLADVISDRAMVYVPYLTGETAA